MNLALSVIALILGPFVYALGRKSPTTTQILDGFIFITVAGIVCVYIIPSSIVVGGTGAVLFLILGLLFPVAIEKSAGLPLQKAHVLILILAALGLVTHAMIDGIALLPEAGVAAAAMPQHMTSEALSGRQLAIGVIFHRLPVGMAIWWSVSPTFGAPAAIATFALVIAATAIAYFFGAPVLEIVAMRNLAFFQAFVAGSIAHVVAFGVSHEHEAPTGPRGGWGFRAGILLGLFLIFTLPHINE